MKCKVNMNAPKQAIGGQSKVETFVDPKSTKFVLPINDMEENIEALSIQLVEAPYKPQELSFPKSSITSGDKAFYVGKKRYQINESSFGPSNELRSAGEIEPSDRPDDMDPFRLYSGFYWTTANDGKSLVYLCNSGNMLIVRHNVLDYNYANGVAKIADIKQLSQGGVGVLNGGLEKVISSFGNGVSTKNDTAFSTQQWVLIKAIQSQFLVPQIDSSAPSNEYTGKTVMAVAQGSFVPTSLSQKNEQLTSTSVNLGQLIFSEKLWDHYIKGSVATKTQQKTVPLIVVGRDYYDFTFSMDVPFLDSELKHYAAINRPMFAKVGFEYNFYIKEYESILNQVSENLLPNMYVLGLEARENDSKNNDYEDLITLDGRIGINDLSVIANRRNANIKDIHGEYFDKYAQTWKDIANKGTAGRKIEKIDVRRLTELRERFSNIAISSGEVDILGTYENNKHLYPMYVDFEFSADRTTYISSLLKKTQLEIPLMRQLISKTNAYNKDFVEVSEVTVQRKLEDGGVSVSKGFDAQVKNRKLWDITEWITSLGKKEAVPNAQIGVLLEKGNSKQIKSIDSEVTTLLSKMFFIGKIKNLIKDKFRTLEELLKGKEAYAETVVYKVEKSLADLNGGPVGEPIQSYYIANIDELETIRLVDTQVKYDVKYHYTVYAYQLIIGTKYRYDSVVTKGDLASILVTQVPMMVLAEVPYFSVSNVVLDNPPVFPDNEMIQYKGIENQVLFWLTSNVGDYLLKPIVIEPSDADAIEKFRKAKQIDGEEIRYRSDDHAAIFQIYRTEEEPKRYSDFAGLLRASVMTDVSKMTPQSAGAAAFVDSLRPGKKYWYCFRCIDVHGHMSNPTDVFQVELVDDAGFVYLESRPFEMKKESFALVRPVRKYIQIAPAYLQELVNEQKSGLADAVSVEKVKQIHLGLREKSVWGKRFKIRLTSKNTGRRLDLNVDFSNRGIRQEEK